MNTAIGTTTTGASQCDRPPRLATTGTAVAVPSDDQKCAQHQEGQQGGEGDEWQPAFPAGHPLQRPEILDSPTVSRSPRPRDCDRRDNQHHEWAKVPAAGTSSVGLDSRGLTSDSNRGHADEGAEVPWPLAGQEEEQNERQAEARSRDREETGALALTPY